MSQCSLVIQIKQFPSLLIVMRGIVYGQHVKNEFFIFSTDVFIVAYDQYGLQTRLFYRH